jgi:hypothetical protein
LPSRCTVTNFWIAEDCGLPSRCKVTNLRMHESMSLASSLSLLGDIFSTLCSSFLPVFHQEISNAKAE